MAGNQASSGFSVPDRSPGLVSGNRGLPSRGEVVAGLVFLAFLGLLAGYLYLYFSTELSSLANNTTRWQLLKWRLFLPEQTVAHWFGTPADFELVDRVPVLAMAAVVLAAGWLCGWVLMRALRLDAGLTELERGVFACGVGLNAISLYTLAVGLTIGFKPLYFLLPAVVLGLTAGWLAWPRQSAPAASEALERADDWSARGWLWLAAPFVATIALGAMLPPIDFDVREYHLQAPKEFYQQGRIVFLPHNVYANMALGSEMLSLLCMVLTGDWWLGGLAGKTVIAVYTPLTALMLVAAGRRFFSNTVGVIAAVAYLSIPWVSVVSTSGLVEGVSAFYLLASMYAFLLWRQAATAAAPQPPDLAVSQPAGWAENGGRLALAGFLAGSAVACKYPAVLFVAAPLVACVALSARSRPWRPVAIVLVSLLLGCGLWFIKNGVLTGNPVYPLFSEWLGGATRNPENALRWTRVHTPHEFNLGALVDSASSVLWKSEWLSPILLPLAALGLLVRKHRRGAWLLAGYMAYVLAAWWLFTHRIDRFWIPVLPLMALLAGVGATWSAALNWRRVVLTVLVFGLSVSFLFVTAHEVFYNSYFVRLARLRRDAVRARPWHLVLNDQVPEGAAVLSVGDAQVFDFAMPVYYNTAFDDSVLAEICQGRTPEQIAAALDRRRISHVYVHWGEISRYREPGNYGGVPDFITPEWFAGLVRQGVLQPPMHMEMIRNQEVYPVATADAVAARARVLGPPAVRVVGR